MEDNKDVVEQTMDKVEEETTQKTYTQNDIDNSFKAGMKKVTSSEEYKEFVEWKKTNQNNSEKVNELQTNYNNANQKIAYLEAQIQVNDSDVKKEFRRFVTSEVMNLVNDTTDFETALKNYKKNNPQYFGEVVIKKVQSSPALQNGTQPQTTNDIMNDLLRGNK